MVKKFKEKIKNIINATVCVSADAQITSLQEQLEWLKLHSDITKLLPATGYLRKSQRDLVAFTKEFLEFVKEIDIHPFLVGGNLIGAVRHGGFIPWDDDMDFAITREESDRLIEFCKKKCIVDIYDGDWNDYSYEKNFKRMEQMLTLYPGQYILDIWVDQLQIYKGTSVVDMKYIDFWPFDYYAEGYTVEEHMRYLDELLIKLHKINNVRQIVSYVQRERKNNPNIVEHKTDIFFPGIDNHIGFGRTKKTKCWLHTEDIFPLHKIVYEDTFFYAPHNIQKYLEYDYPDYMDYPEKIELNPHEKYKDTCLNNIIPVIGIIVQTFQDIEQFRSIYEYFEGHGIYSFFCVDNIQGSNGFESASDIYARLEEEEVRYKKEFTIKCWGICTMKGRHYTKKIMSQTHIVCKSNQTKLSFQVGKHSYKSLEEMEEFIKREYVTDSRCK